MNKKIFITGITGFAGSHLCEYFVNRGYDVGGTYLSNESMNNISNKDKVNLFKLDLSDAGKVSGLIKETKPDLIFHLAALSSPADSFKNPNETISNNISIQINLLEAVKNCNPYKSNILIVSSADVYGKVSKEDLPIDEKTEFNPTNPYAVSKITQDFLALQYFLSYKMNIIRVRPFNHIGPKQSDHFVVSAFAKKIAEIEKGKRAPVLKVGNLETRRDFTDVRDIVYAYDLILEKGKAGDVYNIGSGVSYKIEDILNKLLSFSKTKIKVEIDKNLLRPSDNPELICDSAKIKNLTGWEPKIPIEETLKDTLDYWRSIV